MAIEVEHPVLQSAQTIPPKNGVIRPIRHLSLALWISRFGPDLPFTCIAGTQPAIGNYTYAFRIKAQITRFDTEKREAGRSVEAGISAEKHEIWSR